MRCMCSCICSEPHSKAHAPLLLPYCLLTVACYPPAVLLLCHVIVMGIPSVEADLLTDWLAAWLPACRAV